jgi:hypothetical protein
VPILKNMFVNGEDDINKYEMENNSHA